MSADPGESFTAEPYERLGFAPVIVGGDTGAYAAARAFHEAYGVSSFVISKYQMWMIKHSAIIHHLPVENGTVPEHLAQALEAEPLQRLRASGVRILLLGAIDSTVQAIIALRESLGEDFVVPYVDQETFDAGTIKDNFAALAERLGVDQPVTRVVDFSGRWEEQVPEDLTYPVWAKPADVTAWYWTEFPGKQKVHRVETAEELEQLLGSVSQAGYTKTFVIQEEVPGDDENMRILTCYCDQDSRVRFASWGETVVEDHSPNALGNPSVILTGKNSEAVDQAQKILSALGWVGYANFDLKYDPRDGRTKFFELNPRLGRSSHYVTGAGNNPAEYYVRDWIEAELTAQPGGRVEDQDEVVYTVLPGWLAARYASDPQRRAHLRRVLRQHGPKNPFFYRADRGVRRRALLRAAQLSTVRKFFRYYPPVR